MEKIKNQLIQWLFPVVVSVLLAVGGGLITIGGRHLDRAVARIERIETSIAEIEKWQAETKGNRFTVSDGKEVWKEIAGIREAIARLPNDFPPPWFVKRVDSLDLKLSENGQTLKEIDKRLTKLEARP